MTITDGPLRADALTLAYGHQPVLTGLSLRFADSEATAITGPSGSGKTSLLYCLSGLERPDSGTVTLLGHDLADLSADQLADLRLRHVGFVFQSADLVPELTLRQNIALPLQLARRPRREVTARVDELIALLGITESADRRPSQVSGGQAQRCAVGRAVAARPAVVFADEPTGALDRAHRDVVLDLLLHQVAEIGSLLVTVTHDPDVADRFDRQIVLTDGTVSTDRRRQADGTAREEARG
ncbi:ABC transporter ATP-binding protein [Nocardioides sp.]|uniref:ABC transporter ATP-binding protein n=1 Tax=Nocardioides sp. TaxID=35761 RepID=UPI0026042E9E|nr:ABC transporter ATP-binding protein [Nocardioides sp.]